MMMSSYLITSKRIHVIHWVRLDKLSSIEAAYNHGVNRIEKVRARLQEVEPSRIPGVVNPSPYMAYLQARDCIMVFSSPKILTTVKKGKIINRPLAGTIRQGTNEKEDQELELKLLHDAKQCVEHITLVDLARNDVGKVSKLGTTEIEKLMNIERYSDVGPIVVDLARSHSQETWTSRSPSAPLCFQPRMRTRPCITT